MESLTTSNSPLWFQELDTKELARIAGLGYAPSQIARAFNIPLDEFMAFFQLPNSPLAEIYQKGRLQQDIKEATALAAHATSADTKSASFAQQWERRRKSKSLQTAIDDICFST